jgi:hypothetical protein
VLQGFTLQNGVGTPVAVYYKDGGGVYCVNSSPRILDNVIRDCFADHGAGIICSYGDPEIVGNTIVNNDAFFSGGGIELLGGSASAVVSDNVIEANSGESGGGIYAASSSVRILRNRVVNNFSSESGGGIFLISPFNPLCVVADNLIAGNTSASDGGGVSCWGVAAQIERNVIVANVAGQGGGVFAYNFSNAGFALRQNTIVANSGPVGGGVYLDGATHLSINNIVRDNFGSLGSQIWPASQTFAYSNIAGGWPGVGNIDADAHFRDVDGPDGDPFTWADNNYRLRASSPCIDAGDPLSALDPNGSRADMGALWFDPCMPTAYCVTTPNSAGPGAYLGWTGSSSVSANNLRLTAFGAAPNTMGLFYYGNAQVQVPLGAGVRCVGGQVFRVGPPSNSAPNGSNSRLLDLTQWPMGFGPGMVSVGSTWNFQFWFRDPFAVGATSNLSDALEITFCQ